MRVFIGSWPSRKERHEFIEQIGLIHHRLALRNWSCLVIRFTSPPFADCRACHLALVGALDVVPDHAGRVIARGLRFWVSALDGGASRADVVLGFSESPEFISNTDAALKSFLQTGVPNWSDVLTGGTGDDQMVGGRGSDTFAFNVGDAGADHVYGLEVWDKLQFTGFGYATGGDALTHMSQLGQDVIFNDQGVSITFHNTSLATVDQVLLVV